MSRKRRKRKFKISQPFKFELYGILCVLIAIFGSGAGSISDGLITSWLENSLRFLFGFWYMAASITLLILGIYLMIKRKMPKIFTRRTLGLVIIFIGVLLISHIDQYNHYLALEDGSIIRSTWENYLDFINGTAGASLLGGGMIGALLYAFTYVLFSTTGAMFLAVFMLLVGTVFLLDLSLDKIFKQQVKRLKTWQKDRQKRKKIAKKDQVKTKPALPSQDISEEADEAEGPVIAAFTEVAYSEDTIDQTEISKTEDNNHKAEEEAEVLEVTAMTELENQSYVLPSIQLLDQPKNKKHQQNRKGIQQTVRKLETTFESFGVKAKVAKVHIGPAVTKYEVNPAAGVKVSKIVSLHDDLALALAAKDIRIEAPIPGKSAVGIEVPNQEVSMVSMHEVFETLRDQDGSKLSFVLGRDISGDAIIAELNKMPHLLIAGATGSGKSVCINGIITSILMRAKPHEVKMMMIDPKKVELNIYNGIPHLLAPVVTDPKKAAQALNKVVAEMERRYDLFSETGNRNIESYNNFVKEYNETADSEDQQPLLPYIVVLIDELADLMMVASKEVEDSITRLAQMARAAGIHLIIATQRPSVDVITGVIKANIPSRIAFSVSSQTDSRTILDMGGADKLLGRGDMLFLPVGLSKPVRIQGAFLSDQEVEKIVDHCITQQKAKYQEEMIPDEITETQEEPDDELFDEAVELIIEMQRASVSMLQRRFRIGYTRAARLIDMMEDRGIVGPYEGSKPRKVIITEYPEQ